MPFPPDAVVIPQVFMLAVQTDVIPPLLPAHCQLHGPVPANEDSVPVLQRLIDGVLVNSPPLLLPQVPFTAAGVKTAPTLFATSMMTVQVPLPLQGPVHSVKTLPLSGVAVRVTETPDMTSVEQSEPQLMPVDETMPLPEPDLMTVRGKEPNDHPVCPPRTGQT